MKKIIILMSAITIFALLGFTTSEASAVSPNTVFAVPQETEEPLDEDQVGALLDELKEGLPE